MTPLTPTPSTASLSGVARCWDSNAYFSLFFAIFLRPTEQICPDSAGPFIVSILLVLLFSLFWQKFEEKNDEQVVYVDVPPGVPADRNLCLQNTASHSGKSELIRHHQLDLGILPRTHPRNILVVGNHRRTTKLLLNALACCQPVIVESRHGVVLTLFERTVRNEPSSPHPCHGDGEPAPKSTSLGSIPRRSTCDRNGLHSCTFPDGRPAARG